jgi:lysyl-tRNA synthetase class 2
MEARGFLEVETPVLQPEAGGAAARPFLTHLNALDEERYLRIALELHLKRLIVGGLDRVYELGRIFRNEGTSTRHNPEFTMMESYQAYADYGDVARMVEELVSTVAQEVLGTTSVQFGTHTLELAPPWRRVTMREALQEYAGVDFFDYRDVASMTALLHEKHIAVPENAGWGKLLDALVSETVEPRLIQPTFLLDYPVELSPLAKRRTDEPSLVERFEAFAAGWELGNAYSELNDPVDQPARFASQVALQDAGDDEAEMVDEDFLVALEHGMPPTGGLGIGIDRLVMVLTNSESIRDVILFPLLRRRG